MHPFDIEIVSVQDIEYRRGADGEFVEVRNRRTGEVWRISGSLASSQKGL